MHGPVCVSLVWTDATADLDVCATTPASGEIALENRNAGGGLLDVDDCAYFGKVPSFHCTDSASTHLENVYFDEQPAAGDYTVRVENYHSTASEAVPYTLTVRVDRGAQRPAWELLVHWAVGSGQWAVGSGQWAMRAASHSSIATRQLPRVQRQKRRATYGRTPTASSGFRTLKPSNHPTIKPSKQEIDMLWTIAVILLVLWAVGLVTAYTMGGLIHILIVAAIVMVLIRLFQGRGV